MEARIPPAADAAPSLTYGSYLRLPELLALQTPLSDTHDELLFIIIHQASELWIKLCLHELTAACDAIAADDVPLAMKMMTRVARVQSQLIQSWDILATMTPAEYSRMREKLGSSSGFQSHQYRLMEFVMGNKNGRMIDVHEGAPEIVDALRAALHRPSIYDISLRLLAARGLPIPKAVLERDVTQPYEADPAVEAVWAMVYRDPERFWDLYELAEKLVDLEYRFQLWRFGHLKAIERIIGFKRGTGGTAGVPYLAAVVNQVFFPELLDVRKVL
ncbi:tryptophan 2,3-dioxygenase [Sphingomonas sp. PB4P5]|uniref:tryptophan 2,3-dioxygenase n=1 Tax=Parasphingomonas puruogangriensis TaxID=3096155 RepID=UPI002FC763CC